MFRYGAGLVNRARTELDNISKMWARAYKAAWGLSQGPGSSPIIIGQSEGGRGCPLATKIWIREVADMYEQCLSLPGEISQMVRQYLRQQCTSHGCHTLNQLQYLLQISGTADTVLELFLLRNKDWRSRVHGSLILTNLFLESSGPACTRLGLRNHAGQDVVNWMHLF